VPKGFLPSEDQGRFNVNTEGAQGVAFKDMVQHQLEVADVLMKEPTIASIGVNVGQLGNNATGGSNTGACSSS
jgi:multidrug efflux pump subunit AcrB